MITTLHPFALDGQERAVVRALVLVAMISEGRAVLLSPEIYKTNDSDNDSNNDSHSVLCVSYAACEFYEIYVGGQGLSTPLGSREEIQR